MSNVLRTIILISTAILLWGSILFAFRFLVNHLFYERCLRNYVLSLVDAAFFVLPYLAGANQVINDISNNAWIIVFLVVDIIGYGLIIINSIAILIDIFSIRKKLGKKQYNWYKINKKWDREYLRTHY